MPQSARKQLLAQLPSQCLLNPDEKLRDFVDRWLRMHRGRRPIVAVRLRFVTWPQTGQPSRRFVWELCKWPKGESFEWMFVCWLLDEVGMWWKVFPSKREGLAYFGQAPEAVMARRAARTKAAMQTS